MAGMATSNPRTKPVTQTFASGVKSLPQSFLVSGDVFVKEGETIFSRKWLLVGHRSQVVKPGQYFLAQISGESLIIICDQQSEIRAFYNVCRHRGTRLREDKCGQ